MGVLASWATLTRNCGEDPSAVPLQDSQLYDAVRAEFQRFGWWPGRRWGTFVAAQVLERPVLAKEVRLYPHFNGLAVMVGGGPPATSKAATPEKKEL